MALPSSVAGKIVRFSAGTFTDGGVASGRVTITGPVNVIHTPSGEPIWSGDRTLRFTDGHADFTLCPNDQAGLSQYGWTYTAKIQIDGALTQPTSFSFIVAAAGPDLIDGDLLTPMPSSAGTPVSTTNVTSVNGRANTVVLAASDVGADAAGAATAAQAVAIQRANHTGTQVAATISDLGTAVAADATVRATYVPKWKPNTAYTAGEPVVNPSGQTVTANATFTSGASYVAGNWTVTAGGGGGSTTDASLLTSGILPAARIGDASIADAKLASGTALAPAERTKLTGVATGATANSTDAQLRDRSTHTGTQLAATISDLGAAVVADATVKAGLATAQSRGNTVALLGDSITGNNVQTGPDAYQTNGYWNWAHLILRQRLALAGVFGYPGQVISVIASHVSDVLAVNPATVVVLAGTNDVPANATLTQMQTDMTALLTALRAGGVRIVVGTIPPRSSYTGGQQAVHDGYNRWLNTYVPSIGGTVVNWTACLADPVTGLYGTNMSPDGVHPGALGAARMGNRLAAVLGGLIPGNDLLMGNGDATNLLPHGGMDGNTSGIATGWFVKDLAGSTSNPATVTPTKVTRTDDVLGEWQQLVVATTAGTSLWSPGATGIVTGDLIYAVAEFERNNDWSSMGTANRTLRLNLRSQSASAGTGNVYGMNHPAGAYFGVEAMPMSGVLRTPPMTVPVNLTKIDLAVEFSGLGTIRVGRVEIRKVGT